MRLLLVLVAYHPPEVEVERLLQCLAGLGPEIGYGVVVNDHRPGEPVERLAVGAELFLTSAGNHGYGRAFNRVLQALKARPGPPLKWIGALNTDLSWELGTFECLLEWLDAQPQVVLAVPQITDPQGKPQALCKRDPTLLALASRRFWPEGLKPAWLRRYDAWYAMADQDYTQIFEVPYLSGCCMLARYEAMLAVAGFDERYFLYLEDADLTRRLRRLGQCVHLPLASVRHSWGRGSHRSIWLMLVTLQSAWFYFSHWGWRILK